MTPAQRALAAEPEIRKINAAAQGFKDQESIRKGRIDSSSPGQTLISGWAGLKGSQILIKQLYDRLEAQSAKHGFRSLSQDELAELMREQVASQSASDAIFKLAQDLSSSSTQGVGALFGVNGSGTHWQDKSVAISEMRALNREYCPNAVRPSTSKSAEAISCLHITDDELEDVAEIHKAKWSTCFKQHDWVAKDGERPAYEQCMKANDFVTQMCDSSSQPHSGICVRLEQIYFPDVLLLRNYKAPAGSSIAKEEQKANRRAVVSKLNVLQLSETRPLGNTIRGYLDFDSAGRNLLNQQIAEIKAQDQQTLRCGYVSSDPAERTNILITFWYKTTPAGLDNYLRTLPNHPFGNLGRTGMTVCPATAELADQLQQQSKDYASSLQSASTTRSRP